MKIRYGWYSHKQAEIAGTFLYELAKGGTVVVSQVTDTPNHGTGFDDIACVGRVGKVLEELTRGRRDEWRPR